MWGPCVGHWGNLAPWDLSNSHLTVEEEEGGIPLYPLALGTKASGRVTPQWTLNFRENLGNQALSLFTRILPSTSWAPKSGATPPAPAQPQVAGPAPAVLPSASPARPRRCFSPAEPSPARVAACSRELIPAGRGRRLPGPAAQLSKGRPRQSRTRARALAPASLQPQASQQSESSGPGPWLTTPSWAGGLAPLLPARCAGLHEVTGLCIYNALAGLGWRSPAPTAGFRGHPRSPKP